MRLDVIPIAPHPHPHNPRWRSLPAAHQRLVRRARRRLVLRRLLTGVALGVTGAAVMVATALPRVGAVASTMIGALVLLAALAWAGQKRASLAEAADGLDVAAGLPQTLGTAVRLWPDDPATPFLHAAADDAAGRVPPDALPAILPDARLLATTIVLLALPLFTASLWPPSAPGTEDVARDRLPRDGTFAFHARSTPPTSTATSPSPLAHSPPTPTPSPHVSDEPGPDAPSSPATPLGGDGADGTDVTSAAGGADAVTATPPSPATTPRIPVTAANDLDEATVGRDAAPATDASPEGEASPANVFDAQALPEGAFAPSLAPSAGDTAVRERQVPAAYRDLVRQYFMPR